MKRQTFSFTKTPKKPGFRARLYLFGGKRAFAVVGVEQGIPQLRVKVVIGAFHTFHFTSLRIATDP